MWRQDRICAPTMPVFLFQNNHTSGGTNKGIDHVRKNSVTKHGRLDVETEAEDEKYPRLVRRFRYHLMYFPRQGPSTERSISSRRQEPHHLHPETRRRR